MNVTTSTFSYRYFSSEIPEEKTSGTEKNHVNYYPFDLKHKGYNFLTTSNGNSVAQRWGYTGKEHQDELGLLD